MKTNFIIVCIFGVLIWNHSTAQHNQALLNRQELPETFDLRNVDGVNYVTSVKSQTGGTCWTHGVMAAIEGNLMITGTWEDAGETGEPNLAEYHLDWWNGFNQHYNQDIYPQSSGLQVHQGGDYRVASAYIARGDGPVRNSDAQSFYYTPEQYNSNYHYFYVPDIEWYTVGDSMERIDLIKTKIMENGVLGTCMYFNSSLINHHYIHYQASTSMADPNHSVAIIGWDDNLLTQAPLPGAWLCKNSWGADWGNNGYFWISYYDKHCTRESEMGAVSFQNVEPLKYSTIYYHDYHGWRETKTDCMYGFNSFTAVADEYLSAVSFYTAADNVDFQVKVYDDYLSDELKNVLSTQSGQIDYQGFHTVTLDTAVELFSGDDFYIYLYLSQGGHPYDCTSEVPVLLGASYTGTIVESTAEPEESYFLQNDQWNDFTEFDATGNLCIKGLTLQEPQTGIYTIQSGIPQSFELLQNRPNPFNSSTLITYKLYKSTRVVLTVYDITGRKVRTLVDRIEGAGEKSVSWDGKNTRGEDVSSGVFIYCLRADNQIFSKRMVIIR